MSIVLAKYGCETIWWRVFILAAAIILVLSASIFAATPADYKKRIDSAKRGVEQLFTDLADGDSVVERDSIAEIERLIPSNEKIEWPGGDVETDNKWLRARLTDFVAAKDKAERGAILTGIGERLEAISEAAGGLARAVDSEQTKDQDKQKLVEILRRSEYQKPEAKDRSMFQKWLDAIKDWLSKFFPRPQLEPGASPGMGSLQFGLQILVYAIVIGLIGFLIYKFAPGLAGRFGDRKKKQKQDRVILGEIIGADESASDLFSEAEKLAREGNLRGAIRKGYIAVLCDLSDRKIVRLARHKTNRDYLRDVRRDNTLFDNMTGLTRSFEINWYGLKAAEPADWEDFRERYRRTIADVKR